MADATEEPPAPDLADVRGQAFGRQALEVAAAGGHHLLMIGPAGAGKTMLATRLPGLLPALSPADALEVAKIHSAAGLELNASGLCRPPALQVTPSQRFCGVPHRWGRRQAAAGGDQLRAPGRPFSRRIGRVPACRARQPSPAAGRRSGRRLQGERRGRLSGAVHARCGHERLPLRRRWFSRRMRL